MHSGRNALSQRRFGGQAPGCAGRSDQVPGPVAHGVRRNAQGAHTFHRSTWDAMWGTHHKPSVYARRIPARGRGWPRVRGRRLARSGPRPLRVRGTGACHARCGRMGVGARSTSSSARRPRGGGIRAGGMRVVYAARFLHVQQRHGLSPRPRRPDLRPPRLVLARLQGTASISGRSRRAV